MHFPKASSALSTSVCTTIARGWLKQLDAAFASGVPSQVTALFLEECHWRDLLSLSWDFRTLSGRRDVEKYLSQEKGKDHSWISNLKLSGEAQHDTVSDTLSWIVVFFQYVLSCICSLTFVILKYLLMAARFETPIARGHGVARLRQDLATGRWLAFTFYTGIEELKGYEERVGSARPEGVDYGQYQGRSSWKARRAESLSYKDRDPEVRTFDSNSSISRTSELTMFKGSYHRCRPIWSQCRCQTRPSER